MPALKLIIVYPLKNNLICSYYVLIVVVITSRKMEPIVTLSVTNVKPVIAFLVTSPVSFSIKPKLSKCS